MTVLDQPFMGTYLVKPRVLGDDRGVFVKTFHSDAFAELGFRFQPAEEYFSVSHQGVVRGMHCQLPPYDHEKLVYCVQGSVLDVLLDLRRHSPTFGLSTAVELSANNHFLFLIPKGIAHGFLSLAPESLMIYKTSTVHAPSHDAGVRWNTFGFDWPITSPVVSKRDAGLPAFDDFQSPF